MVKGFQCSDCGQWHDELLLDVAFAEPDHIAAMTADERAHRVRASGDFRETTDDAGDPAYFIRGVIELPVLDTPDTFRWGAWISLSAASFAAAQSAYAADAEAGPFFGWLSNNIAAYPSTTNLKTVIQLRPRLRGTIELEPTDHPLAVEQRTGIPLSRVHQLIAPVLHPSA